MERIRITVGVAGCAAVLATAACRSATVLPAKGTTSHATTTATHVVVSDAQDGGTVHVAVGSDLDVVLHSTYWQFQPVLPGGVLRASPPTYRPVHINPPGTGRGTAQQSFVAVDAGTATITATRNSCGEALRCTGGNGTYRLTVVVG